MKKTRNIQQLVIVSTICLLLITGCSSKVTPVQVPLALPQSFSQSGSQVLEEKWWQAFNDPHLNELIEHALGRNFSLKSSWDRLRQAKAVSRKDSADHYPTLDGEASASHSVTRSDGTTVKRDSLSLGLTAQYEIDLWGKINSTSEAAALDVEATGADLDAAAMTLAAEVATTWYQLVEQNCNVSLLEQQIAINEKGLELISAQFRTGQVPMADVLQQQQLVESQNSEKILLIAERKQSEHQLTILLGLVPGTKTYDLPAKLPVLPSLPETGIPSQLILARPDVRSSFLAVEAADRRVAAAVADRFPALRLSVSLETLGNYGSDIFSNYLASVASALVGPVVDGGQRKAEVERTRAAASEKLHDYGQTILQAFGEIEDALIVEKQQLSYMQSLQLQSDLARQTMAQIKERYLKGIEDYERVLSALTSMQGLEDTLLTVQRDLLVNRIALCRALGGGWQYSESRETILSFGSEL